METASAHVARSVYILHPQPQQLPPLTLANPNLYLYLNLKPYMLITPLTLIMAGSLGASKNPVLQHIWAVQDN